MVTRPVWAEISRSHLLANYQRLKAAAGADAEIMPILKADAYGHGLHLCAPPLTEAGAAWFGVTCAEEGIQLRVIAPAQEILLLSGIWAGEAEAVFEYRLTPVVWEPWQLDLLEAEAACRGLPPGSLPVHLEIDTGMSRQGVRCIAGMEDGGAFSNLLARFHPASPLRLAGVMTHFSAPETLSSTRENPQLANLSAAVDSILAGGQRPEWLHAGNSATIVAGPDRRMLQALALRMGARLMLRPGLGLYGYLDHITCDGVPVTELPELEPVLAWKTRITSLRAIQAGECAGYDNTFVAERSTRLALLPVGYADGLSRTLSNRGHVLIVGQRGGRRAPIAGRVSMDQTIVDVTEIPDAAVGDEAVLLGTQMGFQGRQSITAWDLASLTGTIPWEILCAISARVPRMAVE